MISFRKYHNEQVKKMRNIRRIAFLIFGVLIVLLIICLYWLFQTVMNPNVKTPDGENFSLYIPSGADFETVKDSLYLHDLIIDKNAFEWFAKKREYTKYVKPGRYVLSDRMNNNFLINMLRSGKQTPVKVIFNNIRNIEQLAGKVSEQIEADSLSIILAIKSDTALRNSGFNNYNYPSLFLPNTYEFYWDTDAKEFLSKMKNEYKTFWDESRMKKAEFIGLTPLEVSTLASIVDKETAKVSEMPRIAGVYLNRLKKKWPLQADPTLVFATGNFEIHRVLDVHKEIESPYNTYKYAGLPPGPICIPSIAAINAVLDAEQHKYFYFCAKDDLSGYHVFAKNITEHNSNAEKYRKALNKNRIWK